MKCPQGKNLCKTIILSMCMLLAACTPDVILPTTAPIITPSPAILENCSPGEYRDKLTSNGQVREFILHVPSSFQREGSMALLIGFHGAGSNAGQFEGYSGFSRVAENEGLIVVYPQALGARPTWNTTAGPNNPDIQFVNDIIDHLLQRCDIDPNRIYATGHSNGGGMANRLACDLSDRIAAIGSVAGAYQWSEECSPLRPVAIFAVHGTDDPIIPYDGFPNTGEPPTAYNIVGVPIPQWASSWGTRNECDPEPLDITHNVLISETKWKDCRSGADVRLYTIEGGGHEWPADLIHVASTFWEFFKQHPLAGSPP
ncbi:MAG TPA: PHB depolymerase family esterase [Anaerolineales bacterium]|nr:PHB depolymerase family esterase [Anaerolineales bacterium]